MLKKKKPSSALIIIYKFRGGYFGQYRGTSRQSRKGQKNNQMPYVWSDHHPSIHPSSLRVFRFGWWGPYSTLWDPLCLLYSAAVRSLWPPNRIAHMRTITFPTVTKGHPLRLLSRLTLLLCLARLGSLFFSLFFNFYFFYINILILDNYINSQLIQIKLCQIL